MTKSQNTLTNADRSWIKPRLEKLPLDAAQTGGQPNPTRFDGALTYPS